MKALHSVSGAVPSIGVKKVKLLLLAELDQALHVKGMANNPSPISPLVIFREIKGQSACMGVRKKETHSENSINLRKDYATDY